MPQGRYRRPFRAWPATFRRVNAADVIATFKVVGEEIRSKCQRFTANGLSQAHAVELARRIKEQRELIRQVAQKRNAKHARRLIRLNTRLRRRLLAIAVNAGLDTKLLILK